jgi:hypothetical protein
MRRSRGDLPALVYQIPHGEALMSQSAVASSGPNISGNVSLAAVLIFAVFGLLGCGGTSSILQGSTDTSASSRVKGRVLGGQQPLSGATIQLYAVGTTGDASSATPLITTILTTSDGSGQMNSNANAGNANNSLPPGSFTISGDYTCTSASSEVYFVARGGNPGLTSGTNNTDISLMAALGQCGNLAGSTTIVVNELTTISTINSLLNFMNSYANVGSGTGDATQLQSAFFLVNEYTNASNGTVPGPALPTGYSASSTALQTLGDIVATCVNSSGGVAGDGSPCGTLFTLATMSGGKAPTDTVGAILNILDQPTVNVGQIYGLLPANGPFQPTLSTTPANWYLPITSNNATQLVFIVPPSDTALAASISPAVAVAIADASGNIQTSATNAVTLAIGANPSGGTLSGTRIVDVVNGVATFSNLSINNAGAGYTLTANGAGLPTATSTPFSVPLPAITSITITPQTQTLFLGTSQQFDAVATYGDGSSQDVTATARWTSSEPSYATVSASGLVQGVAAGDSSISASIGSISSSADVTVSASNTGVTVLDDLTDSRLMLFWPGDGSLVSYFGTRNSDGSIAAINGMTVTGANQQSNSFTFDSEGRESTGVLSDGTLLGFDWSSPSNPTLAILPPGQSSAETVQWIATASDSAAAQSAPRHAGIQTYGSLAIPEPAAGTAPPELAQVYVTADYGWGKVPEDDAFVIINLEYPFSAESVPATSFGNGSGIYYVDLPTGPTSLTPAALQSSAASALSTICNLPIPLSAALLCGPEAPACAAVVTALQYTCKAQKGINGFYSAVNFLNGLVPPTVTADATVNGYGPLSAYRTSTSAYSFEADTTFKINGVNVSPASPTIDVGETIPLGAYATWQDSDGAAHPITSSALRWSWSPNPSDAYLSVAPDGTADSVGFPSTNRLGVAIAYVSGINPTPSAMPDTVKATEAHVNVSGTSSVVVEMPMIYGLAGEADGLTELVAINPTTGNETPVLTEIGTETSFDFPAVTAFGNGVYYFYESNSSNTFQLSSVDTNAGSPSVSAIGGPIASYPPFGLQFDSSSGNIYGLAEEADGLTELVAINPTTGNATPVLTEIGTKTSFDFPAQTAFGDGVYYFYESNSSNTFQLSSVDTNASAPSVSAIGSTVANYPFGLQFGP